MTVNGIELWFYYDASGTPYALKFQDEYFYYATNAQGDVTAILNSSGNEVGTYAYDAWGKPTTAIAYHVVAVINPLRYRGYVYDNETELYYLQSRYYNPEVGRFLNSDIYAATGQGLLGNNMFAYCLNNPVNMKDALGQRSKFTEAFLEEFGELVETAIGMLWYVTEHTKKGDLYEHWVESDGKPVHSRHHSDHGNKKKHPLVPHDHEWKDDGDGNRREDSEGRPPDSGFQAPNQENARTSEIIVGVAGTAAVIYTIYLGIKWIVAGVAAPATGGASIIIAGVTP